ncbi:MAG: hypothetical protein ACE5I5_19165 [Candidatus Heimdallarchaeota archaeon]
MSILPVGAKRRSRYRGPVKCLPCEIRRLFHWGETYFTGVNPV